MYKNEFPGKKESYKNVQNFKEWLIVIIIPLFGNCYSLWALCPKVSQMFKEDTL